jgi:sensor histidine kinase regulating citrate/malate metabolism
MFNKGNSIKGKGRGLGIYGGKYILNKYLGGDLEYTSLENEGTTFYILIPKEAV